MDYAVKFEDVSKEYPFYQHITAGFKSFLFNLPKNIASLKKTKFIALREVSFEVKKGETFGIIGRNGSGKSTILGLAAGVMRPDKGTVRTTGKISSLLELGSGFHPDLSGVENIILNGILAGNTKEDMLKKMEMITEFSELGEFIYQPLRTYSSGMQMRLGFSVAVHIDPEILLIDEALSVGDVNFQEKCEDRMIAFKRSGATILLVSHDMPAIAKLCDRAAWIDGGRIMDIGEPIAVINRYLKHLGQPAIIDVENDEPIIEEETETEVETSDDNAAILQCIANISEPVPEAAASEGISEISRVDIVAQSWWDSPIILRQCEERITGDPNISLYEFLKKEYSIANLQKGFSICNRLKGIEDNFVKYNSCRSFDSVDVSEDIDRIMASTRKLERNSYDLLLCTDVLTRIKHVDEFLNYAASLLKDKGFIIAMEYIGLPYSEQELEIADMLHKAFNGANFPRHGGVSEIPQTEYPDNSVIMSRADSGNIVPSIERLFDIVSLRPFAGPLHDLILNNVLDGLDQANKKDSALIKTIIQCERILIKENILQNAYAMIIAKKRSS